MLLVNPTTLSSLTSSSSLAVHFEQKQKNSKVVLCHDTLLAFLNSSHIVSKLPTSSSPSQLMFPTLDRRVRFVSQSFSCSPRRRARVSCLLPADSPSPEDSGDESRPGSGGALSLPLMTSISEDRMPMPGETCRLGVSLALLKQLQQNNSRDLLIIPSSWVRPLSSSEESIGAMVTVLRIVEVIQSDVLLTECRCPSRATFSQEPPPLTAVEFATVEASAVHDSSLDAYERREVVAQAEWSTWLNILEVARMRRKLNPGATENNNDEARIRAWAPKHYDRAVTVDEWHVTPAPTKQTWSRRAESFSFAVIRAIAPDRFHEAFQLRSTEGRLRLADECIESEMKKVRAQLSVKDVLG